MSSITTKSNAIARITYSGPAWLVRHITQQILLMAGHYEGDEQTAWLTVAGILRAAYYPAKPSKQVSQAQLDADRALALRIVEGELDVLPGFSFEEMVAVLGAELEFVKGLLLAAQERELDRPRREAEERAAYVERLWQERSMFAGA